MTILTATAGADPQLQPLVPWWSFGKTVLAAAALRLVDQHRLSLDAPIAGPSYTLRHLLQHTAGLWDYGQFPEYHEAVAARATPWSVEEMLQRAHASTPLFPVGARFSYSNIGYLFVRQIIERTVSANLGTALNTLVFDPLGIEGVFVAQTVDEFGRIVWGNSERYDPRWVYMGCIVGPLSSAATFLDRLLQGDLLAPATKAAMLQLCPYGEEAMPARNFGYGPGVMCEQDGAERRAIGHAGSGPGSTIVAFSFIDRERPQTLAAAIDVDEPDTFPKLIDQLSLIGAENRDVGPPALSS